MQTSHRWRLLQRGITLIEILIVASIVGLLIIALLVWLSPKVDQARDAKRKSDLSKIKIAFEDYYNDNGCYPPESVLSDCQGTTFRPYLDSIPCDPSTRQPYLYVPEEGNECGAYRVYAALKSADDPVIEQLDCDGSCGCGYGSEYNYGVSAGGSVAIDGCFPPPSPSALPSPSPSPSPVPSPSPSSSPGLEGEYTCDSAGVCNFTYYPIPPNCPVSFLQSNCQNQCVNVSARCL